MTTSMDQNILTVESEIDLPMAWASLVSFNFFNPVDEILIRPEGFWLDLCLTPRPEDACARYTGHWQATEFEKVGEIFATFSGESVQFKANRGRQLSIICHLQPALIEETLGCKIEWSERRLRASLDIGSKRLADLLRTLADELRQPAIASELMLDLLTKQIAIELGRFFIEINEPAHVGGLAPWRLRLIDKRLEEYGKPPTLGELARLCEMSVRQLTRGYRTSKGYPIGKHIERSRVQLAKHLLEGNDSIKAIANRLGFSSGSIFSHAFRRNTGISPRHYRGLMANKVRADR